MFIKFLQSNKVVSFLFVALRLIVGYQWVTSGYSKIAGGGFDASGFLKGALAQMEGPHPSVAGWWGAFLENFALPNVELFNFLVPFGELMVGIALILGIFTKTAAFFGLVMNFAFILSGTISINPTMILGTLPILVAGANAGKIGLDYFVRAFILDKFGDKLPKDLQQAS